MSLFRTTTPFLQNLAWTHQAVNALRYNTSQIGSVVPLCFGTVRQPVNLVALGNYRGPSNTSKKGSTGGLPLGGTSSSVQGKGGGSGKGKSGKKGSGDFSVDVAMAVCQGPITSDSGLQVFANAQVELFSATGLNFYAGADGQAADPTFGGIGSGVNYSGTCYVTGTPMQLGKTPAVPNLSFEIKALKWDTGGASFPFDANPGDVVATFLTDPRFGAGFPADNLDNLVASGGTLNTFGDYCQAAGLLISVSLDGQQRAAQWLDGLARLLNTAIVCSGELLKFMPFGDINLSNNGTIWTPNLVPVYSLADADFLPWHPHQDGADPQIGQDDPILVARTNPADAYNWFPIEYLDRDNFYNSTILAVYDQGAIDQYGLRIGDSLSGKCFANAGSAQVAAQLFLQRTQYIRNSYKFQVGWDKALLEPMDIVLLTGSGGDDYLVDHAVRVLSIEENDNGDLTVEAEEVVTGVGAPATAVSSTNPPPPPPPPLPPPAFQMVSGDWGGRGNWGVGNPAGLFWSPWSGSALSPVAADVTTVGPAVIVAFVAYQNYNLGLSGDGDAVVALVSSPSLGGFQRRTVQVMQPAWTDRGTDPIYKTELWWKPAPSPLTNELVTAQLTPPTIIGTIVVYAIEGFSATGVLDPWDTSQTDLFANWNSDPAGPVGAPHFYTGHDRGALLQFAVIDPMADNPPPFGYDYTGLDAVAPSAPSILRDGGLKEDGLPIGSMGYQTCVSEYRSTFSNIEITGNLMTFHGGPGVWPQWMFMVDALYFH